MINAKNHSRKLSLLVAVFILLAGIFIGGYLVLKSSKTSASQLDDILNANSINQATCNPDPSDSNKDSDGDGLKDWQEIQIYQSDPCKADTDGDGFLDGEEVASGYNPTKKAPGDELPGTAPKGPRPLPANLTNALGSMLAQQIAAGKIDSFNQQGQILSSYELEKYPGIQQAVQQITSASSQLFAPNPINKTQIKTTSDNSKTALIKYFDDIKKAIYPQGRPTNQPQADESDIFLNALKNNDFSELNSELDDYQKIYQRLQTITVPINVIDLHRESLEIFSTTIKIYQGVQSTADDPLKSTLALQAYLNLTAKFNDWSLKTVNFISSINSKK